MPVRLYEGNRRKARIFACGAHATAGLSLSREDKRRAIRQLLEDEETQQWSSRRIARYVGVNDHMVADVRRAVLSAKTAQMPSKPAPPQLNSYTIEVIDPPPAPRLCSVQVLRNGTPYVMNTTRLSQRAPAAAPATPATTPPSPEPPASSETPASPETPAPVAAPASLETAAPPPRVFRDKTAQGLKLLHTAWCNANEAARGRFVAWAIKRLKTTEGGLAETSSETERHGATIAQIRASGQEGA
jgi:hypothetical protein